MTCKKTIDSKYILAPVAFAVFLGGTSNISYAQQHVPEEISGLEEIIITARKRTESLQEAPLAITALSSSQLEQRNIGNLENVGAFAPNVVMNTSPSSSGGNNNIQIYIRGIGQTDFLFTTDPGVGIYIDGVFHPRTLGGAMDLLDLERIEVLRGPQGTLFGKNTIGGAVSLISKKPTGETGGWADVTVGRYNRIDVRTSFDFALSRTVFAKVSASYKNRDGFGKRLEFGTDKVLDTAGDENAFSSRLALRWMASDTVTVDLVTDYTREREKGPLVTLEYFDDNGATFGGLTGLWNALVGGPTGLPMSSAFITGDPFTSYATGPNTNNLDAYGLALTVNWDIGEKLRLKSITAYREMDAVFGSDSDGSPIVYTETNQKQNQNQISQELQLIGTSFDDKLDWVLGFFYFDEYGKDVNDVNLATGLYSALESLPGTLNGSPLSAPTAPGGAGNPINAGLDLEFNIFNEIDIKSYAAFTQGTYSITDKLRLTGGARISHEEKNYVLEHTRDVSGGFIIPRTTVKNSWTSFTPMGSLDYRWTDDLMTYVSVSKGFKSGGFNGRPTTTAAVDSFDPETIISYEIGAKTQWLENRLQFNIAAFQGNYTDIQLGSISADATGNLVLRIQNAGKAKVRGIELAMQARPTLGLDINASAGYIDFEFTELNDGVQEITLDTVSPKTPKWTATAGVQYSWDIGDHSSMYVRGDWSYQARAHQDVQNTDLVEAPAYNVFNARLVYEHEESGWSAALSVTNLTNKIYVVNGFQTLTSFGTANFTYGRPREWGFSIKKEF
ncbi:MAG: TonB-dependent receptor [Kordiimonas sp.]